MTWVGFNLLCESPLFAKTTHTHIHILKLKLPVDRYRCIFLVFFFQVNITILEFILHELVKSKRSIFKRQKKQQR